MPNTYCKHLIRTLQLSLLRFIPKPVTQMMKTTIILHNALKYDLGFGWSYMEPAVGLCGPCRSLPICDTL